MHKPDSLVRYCKVFFVILALFFQGCSPYFPPAEIPEKIKKICKDEYNLEVKVFIRGQTLWVYVPLSDLINAQGQLNQKVSEKIDGASLGIHRVLLSAQKEINFYVLYASNVENIGFDYVILGYVPDIILIRLGAISRSDYFSRLLSEYKLNEEALGDYAGKHIFSVDISLPKFLAEQIVQRVKKKFTEDNSLNKHFTVESEKWKIDENNVFVFDIKLNKNNQIPKEANPKGEMLKIIAGVFRSYQFNDFTGVKVYDSLQGRFFYLPRPKVMKIKQG